MRGKSKGQIHPVFSNRLGDLQAQAESISGSHAGDSQRIWQIPRGLAGNDLLNIAELGMPAFNREAINDNYVAAMKSADDPGTVGDVIGLKQQIDYNAAEERAFRLRHATLCRCAAFAAGRRHGHAVGDVFPAVERQAAAAIAAGGVP